jgi:sodium/hydrogen exchanger 8
MWFSGLRGGVAFALAANSYAAKDFMACGGKDVCEPGDTNDSTAILQTTMIIALFTIFVFGGSITDVAIKCDVLEPKDKKKKPKTVDFNHPMLLKWFTNNKVQKELV